MAAPMNAENFRHVYSVKLCQTVYADSVHSLHLIISREDATFIGFADDKESGTGLLTVFNDISNKIESSKPPSELSGHSVKSLKTASTSSDKLWYSSSNKEIYVQIWVKDSLEFTLPRIQLDTESSANNNQLSDLRLICSDLFHDHYDIPSSAELYFRPIILFPLKKIVYTVSSQEAFFWLQNKKFALGLLVEVCEHEILVCKGDVLLAPYPLIYLKDENFRCDWFHKILTLECLPLEHGKMDIQTEVIISYDEAFVPNRRTPNLSPSKNIFISDFCRAISFDPTTETREDHPSLEADKNQSFVLNASMVENQSVWRDILNNYDKEQTFDLHSMIGVPRKLMVQHGLFDGSLLTISILPLDEPHLEQSPSREINGVSDNLEAKPRVKEKLVMVKSLLPQLNTHNMVYISPLVLFNLNPGPVLQPTFLLSAQKLIDLPLDSDVDDGCQSLSSSWSIGLPVATKVEINFINSPHYSPKLSYSRALKKYFATPRLISMGDVIAVKSSDDPEFWQSMTADTGLRLPIMFFKVTRIESSVPKSVSHVVESDKTMLLQKGSDHSYVPKISQYYMSDNARLYWNRLKCPGLNRFVSKLESLLLPFFTQRPVDGYRIQVLPTILLSGPVGCGKMTVIECAALRLCLHIQQVNCHDLIGETPGATESRIKTAFMGASVFAPCILVLKNIHALGKERGGQSEDPRVVSGFHKNIKQLAVERREYPLVIIATTNNIRAVSENMQESFLHDIEMEGPDETSRFDILEALVDDEPLAADLSIKHIAQRTAGFVLGDLVCLVAHARREAYASTLKLCGSVQDICIEEEEDLVCAGVVLQQNHFEAALDKLQTAHSDAIGAPKIPNVTWDDVGGLSSVKSDILDTVQLPLQHPELLSAGLKRSGVLLYGPPGTGKTLLAKAVATECSLNFLSVKGPELINMYVGQSEENIREVFKRARSATPCVIFFDELDSLAPNRGKSADSGGVMDRVVSQLLAELDGLGKSCDVFVIGATNRPDLLDPSLLRPGRFDKLLYLGISEDRETQLKILKALTRKFRLGKHCKLQNIVEKCPWNMTGADFYALSSDAMLNAMKRKIKKLESSGTEDKSPVYVHEEDFLEALSKLIPSVSETELARYKIIRDRFEVSD